MWTIVAALVATAAVVVIVLVADVLLERVAARAKKKYAKQLWDDLNKDRP